MIVDAAEVTAVRAVAAKFVEFWNAHTMERLVDLYAPDADFVNVIGMRMKGIQQIVGVHVTIHEKRMRQTVLTSDNVTVRFIAPTAAVVHDTWSMTGDPGAPGWKIGDRRRGIVVHVLQKTDVGWRIVATQNTETVDLPVT
jgi:uncharacterized protein (TIGR02246 family)